MMTLTPKTGAQGESAGVFRKARRTRFIQDILSQIEQAIIDGKYRVGDKLPSERELCDLFQTSRGPLREALRVLEQKGLITIKAGAYGGFFVTAVTTEQMSESLAFLLPLMTVMGILQPPLAVAMVISGALRGAGETHVVLAAAILGGWCVRLPLAYAAGIAGGLGITAVWTTMLLDWVVRSGIVSWRFRRLRLEKVRL